MINNDVTVAAQQHTQKSEFIGSNYLLFVVFYGNICKRLDVISYKSLPSLSVNLTYACRFKNFNANNNTEWLSPVLASKSIIAEDPF